ncbi:hypothetical protein FRC04_005222 [Tulasnella sp. 424]|nr:hypothetical protein FRC04_005222 [Tulasnella sp. 424]
METGTKAPVAHQFILAGLFPATYETVRTAFTLRALKSARLHQICSGESMWDFYDVVRRWTNNVRPETVPGKPYQTALSDFHTDTTQLPQQASTRSAGSMMMRRSGRL